MPPDREPSPSLPTFLENLRDPSLYDHEVEEFHCVETHISWVLLTGPRAYKIKKPVDLGFVDFSTLEKREHYCRREVELNRRLAPGLYRGVVAITGTPRDPALDGPGTPFEYAVCMEQFDQDQLFARRADRGDLTGGEIDELADVVADFHESADRCDPSDSHATPATVRETIEETFETLMGDPREPGEPVRGLRKWFERRFAELEGVLDRRRRTGFVRECHGDLHLENIVSHRGKTRVFDCIEFNESFRWIDVFSEIAFVTMDLRHHDRPGWAHRFRNRYLSRTGYYEDLDLLTFYEVYRALVRAKVTAIKDRQNEGPGGASSAGGLDYVHLAEAITEPPGTFLVIMHGLSGTGKTTLSTRLVERSGAVRVRSDVERKRLGGLDPGESSGSEPGRGLYSEAMTRRTYGRLLELAGTILEGGFPVVVDATFLDRERREEFRELAEARGIPFRILHCEVPRGELRDRLERRARSGSAVSEAGPAVLDRQIESRDPLTDEERDRTETVRTTGDVDGSKLDALLESLRRGS